jgi:hypothetical protein
MSHPIPTHDHRSEYPEDDFVEVAKSRPRFALMQKVQTSEGYIGHITGYDEGYLNILVTFNHRSAWYNDAELRSV